MTPPYSFPQTASYSIIFLTFLNGRFFFHIHGYVSSVYNLGFIQTKRTINRATVSNGYTKIIIVFRTPYVYI